MGGNDLALSIFIFTILIAFFIFAFIIGIKSEKNAKKAKKDAKILEYSNDELPEYETVEIHATVINQTCSAKMVGIKNPKAIREFFVYFEKDNGEEFELAVSEDVYDGFETGMSGLLTTVDGQLYSFVPDDK